MDAQWFRNVRHAVQKGKFVLAWAGQDRWIERVERRYVARRDGTFIGGQECGTSHDSTSIIQATWICTYNFANLCNSLVLAGI